MSRRNMGYVRFADDEYDAIRYRPRVAHALGHALAAIFVQQVFYNYSRESWAAFPKFKMPPSGSAPSYAQNRSWAEELGGISERELDTAIGMVSTRVTRDRRHEVLDVVEATFDSEGRMTNADKLVCYWRDGDNHTWWELNAELWGSFLRQVYERDIDLRPRRRRRQDTPGESAPGQTERGADNGNRSRNQQNAGSHQSRNRQSSGSHVHANGQNVGSDQGANPQNAGSMEPAIPQVDHDQTRESSHAAPNGAARPAVARRAPEVVAPVQISPSRTPKLRALPLGDDVMLLQVRPLSDIEPRLVDLRDEQLLELRELEQASQQPRRTLLNSIARTLTQRRTTRVYARDHVNDLDSAIELLRRIKNEQDFAVVGGPAAVVAAFYNRHFHPGVVQNYPAHIPRLQKIANGLSGGAILFCQLLATAPQHPEGDPHDLIAKMAARSPSRREKGKDGHGYQYTESAHGPTDDRQPAEAVERRDGRPGARGPAADQVRRGGTDHGPRAGNGRLSVSAQRYYEQRRQQQPKQPPAVADSGSDAA